MSKSQQPFRALVDHSVELSPANSPGQIRAAMEQVRHLLDGDELTDELDRLQVLLEWSQGVRDE